MSYINDNLNNKNEFAYVLREYSETLSETDFKLLDDRKHRPI